MALIFSTFLRPAEPLLQYLCAHAQQQKKQYSFNSDSNGFWTCDSNYVTLNRCEPMAIANREQRFETSKIRMTEKGGWV